MTIVSRTYVSGADTITEYSINPPGFSQLQADCTVETVNKANPSDAFAIGGSVRVSQNTSAGELWITDTVRSDGRYRHGIVIAVSASGAATAQILRCQRTAIPVTCPSKITSHDLPKFLATGYGIGFSNPNGYSAGDIGAPILIAKPSGETWATGSRIYFSILSGVTTYTNSSATASSGDYYGAYGYCSITGASADTSCFVIVPSSAATFSSTPPGAKSDLFSVQTAVAFSINGTVYCNDDRSAFGTSPNSTTSIQLGVVVAIDNTTSPKTYYLQTGAINKALDFNGVYAAFVGGSIFPHVATIETYEIFRRVIAKNTIVTIVAPYLYGQVARTDNNNYDFMLRPGDIALDIDIPAPIGNCRIVWTSAATGFGVFNNPMVATLTRRTTASAPESGMAAAPGPRPPHCTATTQVAYGGSVKIVYFPAPGMPHLYACNDASSGAAIRGMGLPDMITVDGTTGAGAGCQWRWERYNHGTAAWDALTAYAAMNFISGAFWSVSVGLPAGVNRYDLGTFRAGISFASGSGTVLFQYTTALANTIEVYPWDVPTLSIPSMPVHADCRWVGHKGWQFTSVMSLPTVTWGTPSTSYSAPFITVDVGAKPTFATSYQLGSTDVYGFPQWQYPRYQVVYGSNVSGPARSTNGAAYQSNRMGTPIDSNVTTATGNKVAAFNPRGSVGTAIVTVNAWQIYSVDSDYGPVSFMREINGLTATIP